MHLNRNYSETKCFYYRKLGHISRECRKKKNHEEQQKQKTHAGHLANDNHVQNFRLFMADHDENVDADIWYVDSGASTHMTGNKHWLEDFKEINEGAQIYLGDDRSHQIKGCGKVFVILPNGNIKQIHNVMYVPSVTKNSISISMIIDEDLKVEFFKSNCYIKDLLDGMKTIATEIRTGGLYKFDVRPTPVRALTTVSLTTEELWHQRFFHINYNDLLLLQKKEMVRDIPMLKQVHNDCDACTLGKMHRE